jgi:thymidylate synthase (FAD)
MRTTEVHPNAIFIQDDIKFYCTQVHKAYKSLLEQGCPRELARGVLPMNTYTHFFGTVNLHNLFHFIKLRLHEHAQYEIRVYAQALLDLIRSVVPVSVAAFEELQLGKA